LKGLTKKARQEKETKVMSTKRLLGVFAHPDDEGLIGGALLKYHELGVETGLVYATKGEVGEASDSVLAAPLNLGEIHEEEMRAAADALHVRNLWFLGYRDSGMLGAEDNHHPQALIQASPAKVIGNLVGIIRKFRPQVIITFDESGGYGHPDHIAIYKHTIGAFHVAADDALYPEQGPAHSAAKLYYTSYSRRQVAMMAEWIQDQAFDNVFKNLDIEHTGFTEEQINVLLDVEPWLEGKMHAWYLHHSQVDPVLPINRLPRHIQRKWHNREYYQLATTRVDEDIFGENDLFARVPEPDDP
jgi:LmbE family N-acetylglucosaminyl deacetylase